MYQRDVASLLEVERACSKCEKVKWSICVRNFLLIIALALCRSPSVGMFVVFRSGYCWASQVHTPTRSLWNAHCSMLVYRILDIKQILCRCLMALGGTASEVFSSLLLVIWGAQLSFPCCQAFVFEKHTVIWKKNLCLIGIKLLKTADIVSFHRSLSKTLFLC
jgi:hypothetical protein